MKCTILMRRWRQVCLMGAVALLVAQVGGGCGPAEETPPPEERQVGGLSNAEVAAVAQAINETEIELATVAVERATDDLVRRLAQRIVDQHTRTQMQLGQLLGELTIQPITHELGDQVRTEATRERARLDTAPAGGAFDRAFIDGQLQLLNSYLRLLNNRLVQSATIPEYRQVLEQLRDDVNNRFNEALLIRDSGAVPH
jgi:predicted outer membrane protein